MGSTNTNKNTNTSTNANTNKITMGNPTAAAKMPGIVLSGTCDGAVRITLPKDSYTIDGDGNLIIHGGVMSGGETGGAKSPLCPDISYEEFMERADGRSAESRTGEDGDAFGTDFSALGTDPEKMIRECRGTVYGYARCSTLHQDYQRQIDAFLKIGIREENIFKEKKSGKDFNREEFRKMMTPLKPGDCIVVLELDRFGRNMSEIKKHWFWITQHKRADIIVLDQPILNTRLGAHGLAGFLADLVLAVFSLMAEIERKLINKRMEAGIRLARLEGKKLGRKLMEIPETFWKIKEKFLAGKISQNKASQKLGVDPKTFRSWMGRTGDVLGAQEWERLKGYIEEREKAERIRQAKIKYGGMVEPAVEIEQERAAGQEGSTVEAAQKMLAGQEEAEQEAAMEEAVRKMLTEQEEAEQEAATEEAAQKMSAGQEEAEREAATEEATQKISAGQEKEIAQGVVATEQKAAEREAIMGRETNAGSDGEAVGRDVPAESDQADGKAVEKGRRGHRKSKCQKLPGEAKRRAFPGRKPHKKNRKT